MHDSTPAAHGASSPSAPRRAAGMAGHRRPSPDAAPPADWPTETTPTAASAAEAPSAPLAPWLLTALALMCTLLWAGAQIGVKYGLEVAPPFALMGMRFVLASLLLLPVIARTRSAWPQGRAAWGRQVVLGVLNNTFYLGLTALGLNSVSAGLACVLTGLNPLALAIGGALFFNERLRASSVVGLLGALCGVSWVMMARLGSDNTLLGAGIIVLANAIMVAGNLLYKRWQLDCGLLVSHAVQLMVGGLSLLALSAGIEPWGRIEWGMRLLFAETFLIFGVSFGAMLTWLFLLARGSAGQAGAFLFLVPLFGLAEGAVFLHESLSRADVWGAAATTACVWYAQRASRGDN